MSFLWLFIVAMILTAGQVTCQYFPQSPCPDLFNYDSNGHQAFGVIGLQQPSHTEPTTVQANFTYSGELSQYVKGFFGQLRTLGSQEQALANLLDGFPVFVQVLFPRNYSLPTLSSLAINGKVICQGPFLEYSSKLIFVSLDYTFYPTLDLNTKNPYNTAGVQNENSPLRPRAPSCGVVGARDLVPLVFSGEEVLSGDWPWLVAVYRNYSVSLKFLCSGTLVSDQHVMSAAHCMNSANKIISLPDIVIKIGVYNLSHTTDDSTVTRSLVAADLHEDYSSKDLKNDIVVMTLREKVTFTPRIVPACLWSGNTDQRLVYGKTSAVIGWGKSDTDIGGRGTPKLAWLPIVSTATCRARRVEFHKITSDTTLCAGSLNGAGPCNGDSGAGLYIRQNNRWYLRGVVSASLPSPGDNTCNLDEYFVFTDTAQYLPWINELMS